MPLKFELRAERDRSSSARGLQFSGQIPVLARNVFDFMRNNTSICGIHANATANPPVWHDKCELIGGCRQQRKGDAVNSKETIDYERSIRSVVTRIMKEDASGRVEPNPQLLGELRRLVQLMDKHPCSHVLLTTCEQGRKRG